MDITQLIDSNELQDFGFIDEDPLGGSTFVETTFSAIPLLTGIFAVLFILSWASSFTSQFEITRQPEKRDLIHSPYRQTSPPGWLARRC